jgi:RNA polymerase sigma factor (sigma-70 family)
MAPDNELLARWLQTGSEEDFADLVQRHLGMVHSAALRVVNGDQHLAEDITQTVFADLARKARSLRDRPSLAGWLHTSARYAAMTLLRGEQRRRQREQEAQAMPSDLSTDALDWSELRPVIDGAVGDLSAKDREALLLRYFENRSHREIGELLVLNDNAARMRVERALDKVRRLLAKRGITSSASGLAAALIAHATTGTASLTATQITTAALASATAVGSGFTLLHLMTATQLKTGLAAVAVFAGLSVPIVVQHHAITDLKSENAALAAQLPQIATLEAENTRLHGLAADRAELEALRQEHEELLRLRSENDQIKTANAQLAKNAKTATEKLEAKIQKEEAVAAKEAEKEVSIAKMNCVKDLSLAAIIYAQNHGGSLPSNMGEIELALQSDSLAYAANSLKEIASERGIRPEQFEIMPVGKIEEIKDPSNTILLRERQPWPTFGGRWARSYAFVDGHSEIVARDKPEEFQFFEAQRAAGK